jgi:hypothetical protein
VVEQLTHDPKFVSSNPTSAVTESEKVGKKKKKDVTTNSKNRSL